MTQPGQEFTRAANSKVILLAVVFSAALVSYFGIMQAVPAQALCGRQAGCVAGDYDDDWCTNSQEPLLGLNPKVADYFNPTRDRRNRVDDILDMVYHFFDDTNSYYDLTGDGLVRVNDILRVVHFYFYKDCPLAHSHSWKISYPDVANSDLDWHHANANAMVKLGHEDGYSDDSNCVDSLVVLDFGQPDYLQGTYGTTYFGETNGDNGFISNQQIVQAALRYAYGWYHTTSFCTRLHLVIGTNNDGQNPHGGTPTGAGNAWVDVVNVVQNTINDPSCSPSQSGCGWQINVWAGDDIEQPDGSPVDWDCPTKSSEFVTAYNYSNDMPPPNGIIDPAATFLLDYGTANLPPFCPAGQSGTWTAPDLHYVAYGAHYDYPVPELYTGPAVDSWIAAQRYAYMDFKYGPMTDCLDADIYIIFGACNLAIQYCDVSSGTGLSPESAERTLWNALTQNNLGLPASGSFLYATNYKCQPPPT